MRRWILLAGLFAGVVALNWFALPMHDELAYAFAGQVTPMAGDVARVASMGDLVHQQAVDYCFGRHGRVLAHTVVALFSMAGAYHLFDVVNALAWMAFLWGLMVLGGVNVSPRNCLHAFLAAFALLWYAQSCSFDSAFAVNYLWTALLALVAIRQWEQNRCSPLLFLVFGLTQEVFVLPFVVAGLISLKRKRIASFGTMVLGAVTLVLAPAARNRADGTLSEGLLAYLAKVLLTLPRLVLYIAPVILIGFVVVIAIKGYRDNKSIKLPFIGWYFLASLGMAMAAPDDFSPRLLMPMGMAAFVMMLRYRGYLPGLLVSDRFVKLSSIVIGLWFVISVAMQVAAGLDNARMLAEYRASDDGSATRHYVPVFGYTADRGQFSSWHLRLIALENGKTIPPQLRPADDFPRMDLSVFRRLPAALYSRIQYLLPDPKALCVPR